MLIDLPGSLDIYNDFIANFFKVRHALHIKDESGLNTQGRESGGTSTGNWHDDQQVW